MARYGGERERAMGIEVVAAFAENLQDCKTNSGNMCCIDIGRVHRCIECAVCDFHSVTGVLCALWGKCHCCLSSSLSYGRSQNAIYYDCNFINETIWNHRCCSSLCISTHCFRLGFCRQSWGEKWQRERSRATNEDIVRAAIEKTI